MNDVQNNLILIAAMLVGVGLFVQKFSPDILGYLMALVLVHEHFHAFAFVFRLTHHEFFGRLGPPLF